MNENTGIDWSENAKRNVVLPDQPPEKNFPASELRQIREEIRVLFYEDDGSEEWLFTKIDRIFSNHGIESPERKEQIKENSK